MGSGGEEHEVAGDGDRLNGEAPGYERWVVEEDAERRIRWRGR
jgi:hypothetical protein